MTLSPRDVEVLAALCGRVRLFAWDHVRTWWPGRFGDRAALKRLKGLMDHGLLLRRSVQARPVVWVTGPAQVWRPGASAPDFRELSRRLAGRWQDPPRRTTVYLATRRAANRLGGVARGRLPALYQVSHDLGVASVFLHYLRHSPDRAAGWVGEDMVPRTGGGRKRPDAVLRGPDGSRACAVEFGAGYPAARLEAFHQGCEREGLPYEVW